MIFTLTCTKNEQETTLKRINKRDTKEEMQPIKARYEKYKRGAVSCWIKGLGAQKDCKLCPQLWLREPDWGGGWQRQGQVNAACSSKLVFKSAHTETNSPLSSTFINSATQK